MDAPFHFSPDGMSADQIPLSMLIVPLIVVDIRDKAETNPDAQLTLEDLRRWERRHGRIPKDACVAMLSGWAVDGQRGFRGADAADERRLPDRAFVHRFSTVVENSWMRNPLRRPIWWITALTWP